MQEKNTTRTTSIFKHVLFRIAGESISIFDDDKELRAAVGRELETLQKLEKTKRELQLDICEILFVLINILDDVEAKKHLINFKRDIFNGRQVSEQKIAVLKKLFTKELSKKFDQYVITNSGIDEASLFVKSNYPALLSNEVEHLQRICGNDAFRNGLLISSDVLLKYARSFSDEQKKPDESTLLGLWKYFTRTIAKTTPFSTFTQLNVAKVNREIAQPLKVEANGAGIVSSIKYNNYILEILLLLIKAHPDFFDKLPVTRNNTIKETENGLIFFTNNNNKESLQTVEANEIISYLFEKIAETNKINVGQLSEALMQVLDEEECTIEDARKYISSLIQTGMLIAEPSLSGLDGEWDCSLKEYLAENVPDHPISIKLIEILERLAQHRKQFGSQTNEVRENTLKEIKLLFDAMVDLLKQPVTSNEAPANLAFVNTAEQSAIFLHKIPTGNEKIDHKNTIYEDSSRDISMQISEEMLNGYMSKLTGLMHAFSCIPYYAQDKLVNYHFYNSNYTEYKEINLLAFYETYYKAKATEPKAFDALTQKANSVHSQTSQLWGRINGLVAQESNSGSVRFIDGECQISTAFLDKLLSEFGDIIPQSDTVASYGAFMHLFTNEQRELCGICTGILPGSGRMTSRFLHLFDDAVTEDLRAWNLSKIKEGEYHAENSDASFFNANLHPPIMPFEIEMPGGNTREQNNLLNVADLRVRPNHEKEELELYHKDGKRVIIYDLGFQNQMHRSQLYRMLCTFGINYGYPLFNAVSPFSSKFTRHLDVSGSDQKIVVSPRIVFDKNLVLQRKRWQVPLQAIDFLAKSNASQDIEKLYMSLNTWRIAHDMPDQVFVRVHHAYNKPANDKKDTRQYNRDDYKPQYINFLSPMSVKLLTRSINKMTSGNIAIEEMLPLPSSLFNIADKKYVMESLVQWQ